MRRRKVRRGLPRRSQLALLLSLAMAGSLWFYVQRILVPHQEADAAATGRPRGILSDLYPRWLGTRELLLHGRDPYSSEVTREIQTGYYGRPLDPKQPSDPKDQERFAYPVYVAFLLAPTVGLPFAMVRAVFFWLLWILTAGSILLWMQVLRWSPSRATLLVVAILTLGSFGVAQGIKLQQLSLLVGFLFAAGAVVLIRERLFWSGAVFALATIKPQLAILPLGWLCLWTLGRWRERQRFFWGAALVFLLLTGGGEWLLPGWIGRFARGLVAYEHYTGGRSLLNVLLGSKAGTMVAILLLLATLASCWVLRKTALHSVEFQLELAFVLTVTVVVVPMTAPYNHVLLLPGILLVARSWRSIWRLGGLVRFGCILALILVVWPWFASFGLVVVSLALPAVQVQRAWAIPLWTSLGIPLAVLPLLAILLFQVRAGSASSEASAPAGPQAHASR